MKTVLFCGRGRGSGGNPHAQETAYTYYVVLYNLISYHRLSTLVRGHGDTQVHLANVWTSYWLVDVNNQRMYCLWKSRRPIGASYIQYIQRLTSTNNPEYEQTCRGIHTWHSIETHEQIFNTQRASDYTLSDWWSVLRFGPWRKADDKPST